MFFLRQQQRTGMYMRFNSVFGTGGIGKQQPNLIASHCSYKLNLMEKQTRSVRTAKK